MRTTFFDDGGTSLLMLVVYSKCGAALMSGLRRRSAPFPSRCRLVSGQDLSPLLRNPLSRKFWLKCLTAMNPTRRGSRSLTSRSSLVAIRCTMLVILGGCAIFGCLLLKNLILVLLCGVSVWWVGFCLYFCIVLMDYPLIMRGGETLS